MIVDEVKYRNNGCGYHGDLCDLGFGNFPDACTATPFTFKHTYRCEGVNDGTWNSTVGGCLFKPRVRIVDNWNWCTNNRYGDASCRDSDDAYILFGKKILVR